MIEIQRDFLVDKGSDFYVGGVYPVPFCDPAFTSRSSPVGLKLTNIK